MRSLSFPCDAPESIGAWDDVFPNIDWEMFNSDSTRFPPMMRINCQAAQTVMGACGNGHIPGAVLLRPQDVIQLANLISELPNEVREAKENENRVLAFAQAIRGLPDSGYCIVYRDDANVSDTSLIQTLREELTHWKQNLYATKGIVACLALLNHPLWQRIVHKLVNSGYHSDVATLVTEAGAKVVAGAHADVGLSHEESEEFFVHYNLLLAREYGDTAAADIVQFKGLKDWPRPTTHSTQRSKYSLGKEDEA